MASAPLYLYDNPDEDPSFDDAPTEPWSDDNVDPKSLAPVLKIPEVAKLLRVNRKTLYELVRKGQLPGAQRLGHVIRIDRDAVLEWLRSQGRVSRRNQ